MTPPDAPERPFEEPWQAEVFALAVSLSESGVFSWPRWTEAFGARLAERADEGYWSSWLATLEALAAQSGLTTEDELARRRDAWDRAARATPHGRPITLEAGQGG